MTDLVKRLLTVSNMINMGARIAWGKEATLMDEAAAEIVRLRAKVDAAEKMVEVTMACVFDLECYVEYEYGDVLHLPDMFRKYHRDMEPVTAARRAITAYNEAGQ